uniref:Uncharacterized protein n=1 Tax=Anguilla anguilla TaxID=7936 RepID=A0A0E9U2U3_ANGAN
MLNFVVVIIILVCDFIKRPTKSVLEIISANNSTAP